MANGGFSVFRGTLKRLAVDAEEEPARAAAFQWAFPGFLDPPDELIVRSGNPTNTSPPIRRRRYSGGSLVSTRPLPRGRYATVCVNSDGDDHWCLCQELRSYAGSALRQKIYAYDLGESSVRQRFEESGWLTGRRLGLHFVDPNWEIYSRYASIGDSASINARQPGFWRTYLDYIVETVEIDDVVDLRLPKSADWFYQTFRKGFGEVWRKPAGESTVRFQDILPSLLSADLGGSLVTDAIGVCLRSLGAQGLIYPSARCDPETVIDGGTFRWATGFNFVDFRGVGMSASELGGVRFDDPDPWDIGFRWPNLRLEVAELSEDRTLAEQWKGSWRVLGLRQAHEQFWEAGGLLGGRDIGEWEQQETDIRGEFVRELNRRLKEGAAPTEE